MEFENLYGPALRLKYDCLVFDLDDTLYPLSSGLSKAVLVNIQDYMAERLGIEKTKISDYCDLLYKNYGTTMAGLRAIGYDFDYDEYHSFVHGRLPYENLKPDPVLRSILLSLPIRKVIFTNADRIHAAKALSNLGLEDCFEGIICFENLNPVHKVAALAIDEEITSSARDLCTYDDSKIFDIIGHFSQPKPDSELPKTPVMCKPSEDAIEQALMLANIDPSKALFFDDSVRNIQAGKRVGLGTVLVGHSQKVKGADYVLESIHNIKEALPDLWKSERKTEVRYPGKIAVDTPVTA